MEWVLEYVLVSDPTGRDLIYPLAVIEHNLDPPDSRILDVVAQTLIDNSTNLPYSQDSLLTMTKLLVRTHNPRYRDALAIVDANTRPSPLITKDRNSVRRKVNTYAHNFALKMRRKTDAQYVAGSISFTAQRASYAAAASKSEHGVEAVARLEALLADATPEDTFAAAGQPDHVSIGVIRHTYRGDQQREPAAMFLYYRGVGRLKFLFGGGRYLLRGKEFDPLLFEALMPYQGSAPTETADQSRLRMQQLLNGGHATIIRLMAQTARIAELEQEFTDTAAEVLWQGYGDPQDLHMNQAYEAICRVLGKRNAARYAKILRAVARNSADPRLQYAAGLVAPLEPDTEAVQYEAGTISLAAQKQKYVIPYPDAAR